MTTNERYDAITLDLEKADALAGLLEDQLATLCERSDGPAELHALGFVAEEVTNKLQDILRHMAALSDDLMSANGRTVLEDLTPAKSGVKKTDRRRRRRIVTPSRRRQ